MEGTSTNVGKNKQMKVVDDEKLRNYFRWTNEMEGALANVLRDERSMGNKGDGGWKTSAFNSASSILSAQFGQNITTDNIKNRIKIWKKYYVVVNDILSQSGFNWNDSKKMLDIDNESAWVQYVKSHKDAKQFRWKIIPNWDDIVDLCAKDQATGEGAETAFDVEDIMSMEDAIGDDDYVESTNHVTSSSQRRKRENLTSSATSPLKKRGEKNDKMDDAIVRLANAVESYFKLKTSTPSSKFPEVFEVLTAIPGLDKGIICRVLNWLQEDEQKFDTLKRLPDEYKKTYLLNYLPKQ